MKKKVIIIVSIIVVLIIGVVCYFVFFNKNNETTPNEEQSSTKTEVPVGNNTTANTTTTTSSGSTNITSELTKVDGSALYTNVTNKGMTSMTNTPYDETNLNAFKNDNLAVYFGSKDAMNIDATKNAIKSKAIGKEYTKGDYTITEYEDNTAGVIYLENNQDNKGQDILVSYRIGHKQEAYEFINSIK